MMRHNIPSHRDRATYERCHTSDKLTKLNNDNLSQNNPNINYIRVLGSVLIFRYMSFIKNNNT